MPNFLRTLILILTCFVSTLTMAADRDVGIVLMHGKWDRPPTHIMALARQLEAEGFKVVTPTMPWAGTREYDVAYPQALNEIDAAVQGLQAGGAKHVIVAGVSLGANAALAYAASGRPVDAVAALSPGHTPDVGALRTAVEASVQKAREMVVSGSGADRAWFEDRNQGKPKQVRTSAEAYLSYFDPDGMASMTKSCATFPKPIPLFMAVGTEDIIVATAKDKIFMRAPQHALSSFVTISADHIGLSNLIAPQLIAWVRSLGY
ncbi:alpha/beta fold hydrolase [Aquabacterium sp.]|uniref:alpha/beta fold hydrolase n=1 Tax=Aquabacterium sp. TaxID=1872578 RepID=UPI0035B3C5F7